MARQHYQRLSPADVDEIWRRMRAGHSMKPTARALGLPTSTVRSYLVRCGGIRPDPRHRAARRLSLAEREEISRGLAAGRSLRVIAAQLGRAPSTISREVAGNGGRQRYRATVADQGAWAKVTRWPKTCKLATNPALAGIVTAKFQRRWSPQQIAGEPKTTYPDNHQMQVSHESIYLLRPAACPPQGTDRVSADRAGHPTLGGSPAARWARWAAPDPTSPSAPPRHPTGRCPATGKATWSSASA